MAAVTCAVFAVNSKYTRREAGRRVEWIVVDKETIHAIIEIITVLFMPICTYIGRNMARDISLKVKDALAAEFSGKLSEVQSGMKAIERNINQIQIRDSASDVTHKEAQRRINALEMIYDRIDCRSDLQQRLLKKVADKMKIDDD